jgi:hypothetical protein
MCNGAAIQVEVRNRQGVCRGVRSLETGGHMITSNRVSIDQVTGQNVIVHMGERTTVETGG